MNKLAVETFEKKCSKVHDNKYIYHQDFRGLSFKVKITCPDHGDFYQKAYDHLYRGSKCFNCSRKTWTMEDFEKRAIEKFKGKFTYHQDFVTTASKIKIICPIHGLFYQNAQNHIRSKEGCPRCGYETMGKNSRIPVEVYEKRAKEKHGDKFTYFQDYTGLTEMITVKCPEHGIFKIMASSHLTSKYGCQQCGFKANGLHRKGRKMNERAS